MFRLVLLQFNYSRIKNANKKINIYKLFINCAYLEPKPGNKRLSQVEHKPFRKISTRLEVEH